MSRSLGFLGSGHWVPGTALNVCFCTTQLGHGSAERMARTSVVSSRLEPEFLQSDELPVIGIRYPPAFKNWDHEKRASEMAFSSAVSNV